MNIKTLLMLLAGMLLISALQAVTLDEHYQNMLSAYGRLNTWQAELSQTNYFSQSKAKLTSNGTFYYQKGAISIRYHKPNEQFLLIKDSLVTIYDKSSNIVVKSGLLSSVQSLDPVEIVKTYWKSADKTLLNSSGKQVVILLKPKSDKQIKEILVTLDSQTSYVNKLSYTDLQGNSVEVAFYKMQINKPIPASAWKLDIPPGAQIIER